MITSFSNVKISVKNHKKIKNKKKKKMKMKQKKNKLKTNAHNKTLFIINYLQKINKLQNKKN